MHLLFVLRQGSPFPDWPQILNLPASASQSPGISGVTIMPHINKRCLKWKVKKQTFFLKRFFKKSLSMYLLSLLPPFLLSGYTTSSLLSSLPRFWWNDWASFLFLFLTLGSVTQEASSLYSSYGYFWIYLTYNIQNKSIFIAIKLAFQMAHR